MNNNLKQENARQRKLTGKAIVEMLYNHCWGTQGNADMRDKFKYELFPALQKDYGLGDFTYSGDGIFNWE